MNFLFFLGTGGGRYITSSQARATGGIYFSIEGVNLILDPGPGSLVYLRKNKLKDPSGILLSHYHIDHCNDANALIDFMKEPFVLAEEHCITGDETNWPCISKYHMKMVKALEKMKAGDSAEIPGSKIKITATKAMHTSPTIGFAMEFPGKKIGYLGDTIYFKGVGDPFEGCDLLIMNVLVPHEQVPKTNKHLGIGGAIEIINSMKRKPGIIILQHFSFWMLQHNPSHQARILEEKTGVKVLPARDFMKFSIDRMEEIREKQKSRSLGEF